MNTLNEYEKLKGKGYVGFASQYLQECVESKSDDQIDIEVYTKLVQLDSRLGTSLSEQLRMCLQYTTRPDIIQVLIFAQNSSFKIILDYRLRTSE